MLVNCSEKNEKDLSKISHQLISNPREQDSLFRQLFGLINCNISGQIKNDSLSFLILPVEAACPSCRKKTIDSILKYKSLLDDLHFVIISGTNSKKIKAIFIEQGSDVPIVKNKIFIDSTNEAFIQDLVYTKPAIYYAFKQKIYRKVSCKPVTIKEDLGEFFGGLSEKTLHLDNPNLIE